jgi:RHS repeat-associated protein
LYQTSSIPGLSPIGGTFNQDDELATESYDQDGNVITSGGKTFAYDTENHLTSVNGSAVTMVYDGDGNRVKKIVSGVTTQYLIDDLNPTGYPQVVEELTSGAVSRTFTYGLQRISQNQLVSNTWTPSFYGYDGLGTVRQLTNSSGTITDTYDYDAFGNKINSTGTTPNDFLYRGEEFDSDLSLYYLRARYMNPLTGRFMSRDPLDGDFSEPLSLHKYLYADGDPVNRRDPSGLSDLVEVGGEESEISEGSVAGEEAEAKEVSCIYQTAGAALDLVVPGAGQVLESVVPQWKSCKAKAKSCSNGNTGFRAVSEKELYSINEFGFTPSPMGGEVKYFSNTVQQAWKFAQIMYKDGNFGIVKGEFPCSVPVDLINPATEGPGFTVANQYLSQGIPTILWP